MREIGEIQKLAIISLFSDDDLMELFVLKGGNALNIAHGINDRSSIDIDVSMEDDFDPEKLDVIFNKLHSSFEITFEEHGYQVFDTKLVPSPFKVRKGMEDFWGGYTFSFKIIEKEKYNELKENTQKLRVNAIPIGNAQEKTFEIDISKYEYCKPKESIEIEGFTIYVYTPLMVIYEKLRAICQQMVEYGEIVRTNRKPRPRDFFDICTILDKWPEKINLIEPENLRIIVEIFKLKKVPLEFLTNIDQEREFHRDAFTSVINSVSRGYKLGTYDYYFDTVVKIANEIYVALEELRYSTATGKGTL